MNKRNIATSPCGVDKVYGTLQCFFSVLKGFATACLLLKTRQPFQKGSILEEKILLLEQILFFTES